MNLTDTQAAIRDFPPTGSLFVSGPAGAGKTTAAAHRLLSLLDRGIDGGSILLFAPQQAALAPYQRAIRSSGYAGVMPTDHTIGSLTRFVVAQFFPVIADDVGFADPDAPPTFLSLETAQYVMARLVDPLAFAANVGVRVDKQRIYSQILDNLNKAALVGFPHTEIGGRLKAATIDATAHPAFDQAQRYAELFRAYCLEYNLLDFSLQIEVFRRLWTLDAPRRWLTDRARHVIIDNIEEDAPVAHAVLRDVIAAADSALVSMDTEGGYRRFLGADALSAEALGARCTHTLTMTDSFVMTPPVAALGEALGGALGGLYEPAADGADPRDAIAYDDSVRYFPQMLDWAADSIAALVADGLPPNEIAVLAPFMSDSLRFSLMERLRARGIPGRTHRPSRSLREEPAAECLLTWAQIAHPEWQIAPPSIDALAYALMQSLGGVTEGDALDLVRARLLASAAYPSADHPARLRPFDDLPPEVRERVTYTLGQRYDVLRVWLETYIAGNNAAAQHDPAPPPAPKKSRGRKKKGDPVLPAAEPLQPAPPQRAELDHFFMLIFGEVLARRGFGFHAVTDAATAAANLIESARGFRQTMLGKAVFEQARAGKTLAEDYVEMVRGGVIANVYPRREDAAAGAEVLLAPAYTFLNNNLPVSVQFWLDVGSRGWFERLYQPLTHPYVLSAHWEVGRAWLDDDEYASRQETLRHLVYGLTRRCRNRVYLGLSELSESGHENAGELLAALNRMLRRAHAAFDAPDTEEAAS